MNKAVFLDRDGVVNEEIGDYVYTLAAFKIVDGVIDVLRKLKSHGFYLIVITNQAGIAKGIYGHREVRELHDYFQDVSGNLIDRFYYAPHHPDYNSESLSRKPESLLFEKAMAYFHIDPRQSWMIGDNERDLIPAKKLGLKTIHVLENGLYNKKEKKIGDFAVQSVAGITDIIIN